MLSGVLIIYILVSSLMFIFIENKIGGKVMKNQSPLYMWVGLGYDNSGLYNKDRYDEFYNSLKENNMNYKVVNNIFMNKLKNEILEKPYLYPGLLLDKSLITYGDDSAYIYWINESIKTENASMKDFILKIIYPLNERMYIIVVIMMLIGLVVNTFDKKNNHILFISLIIYGSYLMLLFPESQGRYKYTIEPLFCILAAFGLYYGYEFILKTINNRNKTELKLKKEVKHGKN